MVTKEREWFPKWSKTEVQGNERERMVPQMSKTEVQGNERERMVPQMEQNRGTE
ncbi:hypothetical protein J19TS1_22870 [Heyndrickxia oleronia]|nr:hypothetical protein J19TS1_22870 [Heyndrickxia oleronia]